MIKLNVSSQQEAFNKAYLGIIGQGGPALDNGDGCSYRGVGGRKCGIGHLIDDADYDYHIEGKSIVSLTEVVEWDDAITFKFLQSLQASHDRAVTIAGNNEEPFLKEFSNQMSRLASSYKLEVPQAEGVKQYV